MLSRDRIIAGEWLALGGVRLHRIPQPDHGLDGVESVTDDVADGHDQISGGQRTNQVPVSAEAQRGVGAAASHGDPQAVDVGDDAGVGLDGVCSARLMCRSRAS
ncbi:hypothetical protein [Micromonospora rhizosphaerae]|uniref:hypothetical protein n=1 Tax=Micromonospora rhizosphaerae TaxID=568872 RepID=UPI00159F00D9|nr:hypothetical protein [Micromonospora rhizosphaerae]